MNNKFFYTFILFFAYCSTAHAQFSNSELQSLNSYCICEENRQHSDSSLLNAGGLQIIKTGYEMTFLEKAIVKGSCWDFVNHVFMRAGLAENKNTIFKSKKNGPYVLSSIIQPGDRIYHVNHQFNNVEHSAIFVCWKDFSKRIGITLSYVGMNRNVVAKFGEYQLNNIYGVFRAQKNN
jgi:hypothetical protein